MIKPSMDKTFWNEDPTKIGSSTRNRDKQHITKLTLNYKVKSSLNSKMWNVD